MREEHREQAGRRGYPEFVCRWAPGGAITFVNESYSQRLGKKAEDLVGSSFLHLIPKEDRREVEESFASLRPDNPAVVLEHRIIGKAGEMSPQQYLHWAVFDDQGRAVEYHCTGTDITALPPCRDGNVAAGADAQDAARAERDRINRIMNTMIDGVHIINRDLELEYLNPVVENEFGPYRGEKC